jgi:hypothetical protein
MGRGRVKTDTKGRSCTGKTCYTRTEAIEAAWYNTNKYLMKWAAYPCRHCPPNWHIGHSNGPRGRDGR